MKVTKTGLKFEKDGKFRGLFQNLWLSQESQNQGFDTFEKNESSQTRAKTVQPEEKDMSKMWYVLSYTQSSPSPSDIRKNIVIAAEPEEIPEIGDEVMNLKTNWWHMQSNQEDQMYSID